MVKEITASSQINTALHMAALLALLPAQARAEDFSMAVPVLASPFLLAGMIAALVLRFRIKRSPACTHSVALKRWALITGIPNALGVLFFLLSLLDGKFENIGYLVWITPYCAAFYSAYRADLLAKERHATAERLKKGFLLGLSLLWAVSILLGIAGAENKKKKWEATCAADRARFPEPTEAERQAFRRKDVLIDLRKQIMKDGRTVGEAMATDPALKKRVLSALEMDELSYPPVNDLEYHTRFNKEALKNIGIEFKK